MLQTRDGWQEIVHKDGKVKSYMAIFTPQGPDNWDEVVALFPAINKVIKEFNLTDTANVSLSASVLTIVFHTDRDDIPDNFKRAGAALIELIAAH